MVMPVVGGVLGAPARPTDAGHGRPDGPWAADNQRTMGARAAPASASIQAIQLSGLARRAGRRARRQRPLGNFSCNLTGKRAPAGRETDYGRPPLVS